MTVTTPSQQEFDSLRPEPAALDPQEQALQAEARERLRQALQDPAFRAIEGFPIGTDEAILALSDPPFYTACPNPFLPEIITEWQAERARLREELGLQDETYQRDPFAADVSEGKNDPIYNAHSYHTKVPHKAIMRYILHYTDPGDIVFDGFCGTGMTGVAAQLCGDREAVQALGYRVDEQGVVWEGEKAISRLGARKAVLNDLSPAATFIAYNYNTPVDAAAFEREARYILNEVEQECGWMYETWHPHCDDPNRVKGRINFTVWSDVFLCPQCGEEMVFWDEAVDKTNGGMRNQWNCLRCSALVAKNPKKSSNALKAERAWESYFDKAINKVIKRAKQRPVLINYSVGRQRYEKSPDREDKNLLNRIEGEDVRKILPKYLLPTGYNTQQPMESHGITYVHHLYTWRNANTLASLWEKVSQSRIRRCCFWFTSTLSWCGRENRLHLGNYFGRKGGVITSLRGTWYIASLSVETNPLERFSYRIKSSQYPGNFKLDRAAITTQSSSDIRTIQEGSIDYIFVDPPFGGNLMYSELNIATEAWLGVLSNNKAEAIQNKIQKKGLPEYQKLMELCFREFFRLLKPGHWITVEFHNSWDTIWNIIQESIIRAGFMIADVRTLDKGKGSFKQVTTTSAVKQDLVISAYKPNGKLEDNFKLKAGTEESVWEFIRYHLGKLPVIDRRENQLVVNPERQAYLLFDRMVAFHIQHGVSLPISAPEFYAGLEQRFIPRDGMYFLPEQVAEYDRAKLEAEGVVQIPLLVTDEKTAIAWLRQQLDPQVGGPQTAAELNPKFKMALYQAKHELAPELSDLLQQNFLQDEDGRWYIPDPNKAEDLEKVRQRALLREFGEYVKGQGRLRQFRTEAVRAGFLDCLNRQDYATLLKVAKRLPEELLRSDPDLLMYYDSALLRSENG